MLDKRTDYLAHLATHKSARTGVFKGTTADAPAFYNAIFTQWLPANAYMVDDRPHFAVMGAKYKHNDPESEEEIWIPVKTRS